MNATVESPAIAEALARAKAHSPFLRRVIEKNKKVVAVLQSGGLVEAEALLKNYSSGVAKIDTALRRERLAVALVVAIGDLSGGYRFRQVVRLLSDFADHALDRAILAAFADCAPGSRARGFSAIALGKHGSRELNYSSDIDLIFIADHDTLPRGARGDPQHLAIQIARRVVEILQVRTGEGYVFRVDLRLRPSPEATPIVLPLDAAISYYESSAEPWERAAFIRARAVGGDTGLGKRFLEMLTPFVWRRALDFGAIKEIRAISRRIRDHYAQGQKMGPGFDLKRGRGGIREIEFFTQIHQLIHGGRDPELRIPATLDALAALGAAGHIAEAEVETLGDAYRLFRTIEHRLQMVDDQQTHSLPADADALDNVARLHGLDNGESLIAQLTGPTMTVAALYDELDEGSEERLSKDPQLLENHLRQTGLVDVEDFRRRIEGWRDGKHLTTRSATARDALEAILPGLIADFARSPDPLGAINRFDTLLDRLPSAVNFFRLIEARPGLGRLLVDILSHAPALADQLSRRSELFDSLIDATALDPPEPLAELVTILRERSAASDYQLLLDRMRQLVGEERFALGVQLIEGASDPLAVAGGYARVAEAALTVLADAAVAEFETVHGRISGGELVILALGRLGGGALTHASDLDLVYLFTGAHDAQSDGERPLGATRYFQRLAQRVTAALSVPTAAGPLYDVDTRLRPSGAQGLLAVSFDSFAAYHRDNAWTWEHMALARARPVFGSSSARNKLSAMIEEILRRPRDRSDLLADVRAMRTDLAKHKPPAGSLDVKLIEGGLVDLEFCVHLIQLGLGAGIAPQLSTALDAQIEAGLIAPEMAASHGLLTRMLVTLRLVSPASTDVPSGSRDLVAKLCGASDWNGLLADYERARQCVIHEWRRLAEIPDNSGDSR